MINASWQVFPAFDLFLIQESVENRDVLFICRPVPLLVLWPPDWAFLVSPLVIRQPTCPTTKITGSGISFKERGRENEKGRLWENEWEEERCGRRHRGTFLHNWSHPPNRTYLAYLCTVPYLT